MANSFYRLITLPHSSHKFKMIKEPVLVRRISTSREQNAEELEKRRSSIIWSVVKPKKTAAN
ncbi:hypothetical protein LOAG_05730 [Loa loa]|uniref:Ovule protein n=1 Tax=Loa loa TaxID=7209 RepID=A0A1I7VQW4_LOALO|nr:hypothetical protein LOAG_05730 [Loa loa]EFO22754.2 hypothetical protein LOAG_05730 [Loa loa]